MRTLLKYELLKTYRKWRTYMGFAAILVLIPVVEIALKLEGGSMVNRMTRTLSSEFFLIGNLYNGYFITQMIMNSLWIHIPFLIALVAGDQLAGEATAGTFRLMLTRPPSRARILCVKYFVALFYTLSLVVFLGVLSLGLGLLLFGSGDLLVPGRVILILPEAELPFRMFLAFGLAIWSMWCVASLAFLFSSLVENAIGPIIGTMTVIIVFYILSNLPVEFFASLKSYFFTTYFNIWQKALEETIPWSVVAKHGAILGGFSVGFLMVTWYIFVRKDILS